MVTIQGTKYKVTSIAANALKGNKKVTKLTVGKNITSIGKKAFYKCTKLSKITIPAKVSKIGKQAFYGCKKLATITIKTKKLTSKKVGSKAFTGKIIRNINDLIGCGSCYENYEVICSDALDIKRQEGAIEKTKYWDDPVYYNLPDVIGLTKKEAKKLLYYYLNLNKF